MKAECLQIFTRAPSQWKLEPLLEPERFRAEHKKRKAPPVFAHDIYLSNVASPDETIRERSIRSQIAEMHRCAQLGVRGLVVHMGSHPDEATGLQLLSEAIHRILTESPTEVQMLLETCAGQGNTLGHRFEHLARVRDANPGHDLGVCLDTCHVFAAGYDLSDATWAEFDRLLGRDALKLLHLNDSLKERGSRVDRHAGLGEGKIGADVFQRFFHDPHLAHVPAVIETPGGDEMHAKNLRRLKRWRTLSRKPPVNLAVPEPNESA